MGIDVKSSSFNSETLNYRVRRLASVVVGWVVRDRVSQGADSESSKGDERREEHCSKDKLFGS